MTKIRQKQKLVRRSLPRKRLFDKINPTPINWAVEGINCSAASGVENDHVM